MQIVVWLIRSFRCIDLFLGCLDETFVAPKEEEKEVESKGEKKSKKKKKTKKNDKIANAKGEMKDEL